MDEMLARQAAEFKGLEKQLKMGGSDDETDPDLKELNKQLAKRGNRHQILNPNRKASARRRR